MLTRKQRAQITIYCLKKLYPLCVKRKNLFSDKSADDLVEELGVHIWVALTRRYRNKPIDQALKLAMQTGVNRLRSIVRTRMTVVKRGSEAVHVPYYGVQKQSKDPTKRGKRQDNYALTSKDISFNGVQIVDTLEAIVSAAIIRVGPRRANALVHALMYDWRKKKLVPEQTKLMGDLKRTRKEVRRLVNAFTTDIRAQGRSSESATYDNLLQKIDGRWKRQF